MKIRITADSTCDLSPELIEKYNVKPTQKCFPKRERAAWKITEIFIFKPLRRGTTE